MRLSASDAPVSDDATRSGAAGADGGAVSRVNDVDDPAGDTLPAGSVRVPDTDHVPSVSAGDKSHDVADPMVYVQLLVTEPFVAEIVATSPVDPPETENVGVVSLVTSSELDRPVSEAVARSGTPGADGAVVSLVTELPFAPPDGPLTPEPSVTESAASRGVITPSVQDATVNVKVVADPEDGDVENVQPVAAPAFEKSTPERVDASTAAEKVTE